MDFNPIDLILHLDTYLAMLVSNYGVWIYAILFLVIFCETGLVVTPFLPGDSLLFIAGAICATGGMDPWLLGGLLMVAAITGDSTNYVIGRTLGKRLFSNPDSKVFRRDYLDRTHEFYERHGGKTVTWRASCPSCGPSRPSSPAWRRCTIRASSCSAWSAPWPGSAAW